MSPEHQVTSRLEGLQGPLFPPLVDQLGEVLESGPPQVRSFADLERAVGWLPLFGGVSSQIATDGYPWFAVLQFNLRLGFVFVALPQVLAGVGDVLQLDRSPAVYVLGAVTEEDIDAILVTLISVLRRR
jgi:hypothetical protein